VRKEYLNFTRRTSDTTRELYLERLRTAINGRSATTYRAPLPRQEQPFGPGRLIGANCRWTVATYPPSPTTRRHLQLVACNNWSRTTDTHKIYRTMASILLLGFGLLFLGLSHNTMLYFCSLDKQRQPFPLWRMVLPWPRRGKFVSLLAGLVSCLFVWGWLRAPADGIDFSNPRTIALASAFVVMPASLMASFYWRRIKRTQNGVFLFDPIDPSPVELGLPAIVTATLTGGAMAWEWLG